MFFLRGHILILLNFQGMCQLAQTGKPDATLLVFLYNNLDDSAVLKQKPKYITRVNTKGDFKFHNLASGIYNVFL